MLASKLRRVIFKRRKKIMESTKASEKTKLPLAFWFCSGSETFERLSFYLGRSIILLFVATSVAEGGLGLSDTVAANMQANMTAFSYLAAIFGGYVVDHWIGARWTTPVGMLIAGAGYFMGSIATGAGHIYAMIVLVSVGLGLFKNAPILGRIITDKKQMDSAFSIRYMLVNVGSTIGTLVVGVLYKDVFAKDGVLGFVPCFRLAAVVMVLGAIWYFTACWSQLGDVGRVPFAQTKTKEEQEEAAKLKAEYSEARKMPVTTIEKKRISAIVLVAALSIIFWVFWYLAFLPLYYYWADKLNWIVFGYEMPITWAEAFNGIWCIVLAPVVSAIWTKLSKRPQGDISIFKKTGLAISFLGLAYIFFVILDIANSKNPVSALWMIVWAFLLTAGEMTFSPLGHSFISKYSPSRYLGVMMAMWSIATFIAGKVYGYAYGYFFGGNFEFRQACIIIAVISFVAALLIILLDKKVSSLV